MNSCQTELERTCKEHLPVMFTDGHSMLDMQVMVESRMSSAVKVFCTESPPVAAMVPSFSIANEVLPHTVPAEHVYVTISLLLADCLSTVHFGVVATENTKHVKM